MFYEATPYCNGLCALSFVIYFNNFSFFSYKVFVFLSTLIIYAAYKIAMRSISVVKPVLQRKCPSANASSTDEDIDVLKECQYPPFGMSVCSCLRLYPECLVYLDGDNASELLGTIDFFYMLCYAVGQMSR